MECKNTTATEITIPAEIFYTEVVIEISEENVWDLTREKAKEIATAFIEEIVGIGADDVVLTKVCPKEVIKGFAHDYMYRSKTATAPE